MTSHPLNSDVARLQGDLCELGTRVGRAISMSVENLDQRDFQIAEVLIAQSHTISRQRLALEIGAFTLLATGQYRAGEAQQLTAILEIAHELDVMADDVARIATAGLKLGNDPLPSAAGSLHRMAGLAHSMLNQSCAAFAARDTAPLRDIAANCTQAQALHTHVVQELLRHQRSDAHDIDHTAGLRRVAFDLAHIADRALIVGDWVVFAITGEINQNTDRALAQA